MPAFVLIALCLGSVLPVHAQNSHDSPLDTQLLPVGELFSLIIRADGESNPPARISADALPDESVLLRNLDGSRTFMWIPRTEDIGNRTIEVTVTDAQDASISATYPIHFEIVAQLTGNNTAAAAQAQQASTAESKKTESEETQPAATSSSTTEQTAPESTTSTETTDSASSTVAAAAANATKVASGSASNTSPDTQANSLSDATGPLTTGSADENSTSTVETTGKSLTQQSNETEGASTSENDDATAEQALDQADQNPAESDADASEAAIDPDADSNTTLPQSPSASKPVDAIPAPTTAAANTTESIDTTQTAVDKPAETQAESSSVVQASSSETTQDTDAATVVTLPRLSVTNDAVTIQVGKPLRIPIEHSDSTGQPADLNALNLPPLAQLLSVKEGHILRWMPTESDLGTHVVILVATDASDSQLRTSRRLLIQVEP